MDGLPVRPSDEVRTGSPFYLFKSELICKPEVPDPTVGTGALSEEAFTILRDSLATSTQVCPQEFAGRLCRHSGESLCCKRTDTRNPSP